MKGLILMNNGALFINARKCRSYWTIFLHFLVSTYGFIPLLVYIQFLLHRLSLQV